MLSFFESVNSMIEVIADDVPAGLMNKEISYQCLFNKFDDNECVNEYQWVIYENNRKEYDSS